MRKLLICFPVFLGLFPIIGCKKVEPTDSDVNYPAAYVINGESNSISIINLDDNTVTEECKFKKGTWPHHVYASASKDKIVISLTGVDLSGGHEGHDSGAKSFIVVLDATNLEVLAFLKTGMMAHNSIFVNNDEEIWLPQIDEVGEVLILDSKTLEQKSSIAVGGGPLEITMNSSGNYAFVANGDDNTISVIDIATKTVVQTIGVGEEPVGAWPASNNKMYVDCEISKEIFEIDCAILSVTDTISLFFTPAYVNFNTPTGHLWVSDAEFGKVHTYELVAGEWIENGDFLTGANAHAIAFNSAGDRAYVTNQSAGTVSVINAISFEKIVDIPVGDKPNGILLLE